MWQHTQFQKLCVKSTHTISVPKSVNPGVDIDIVWVYTWYDPGKEKDAADALFNNGCDVIAQHTDSPAPLQAAEERGLIGFGQASDQYPFCS